MIKIINIAHLYLSVNYNHHPLQIYYQVNHYFRLFRILTKMTLHSMFRLNVVSCDPIRSQRLSGPLVVVCSLSPSHSQSTTNHSSYTFLLTIPLFLILYNAICIISMSDSSIGACGQYRIGIFSLQ